MHEVTINAIIGGISAALDSEFNAGGEAYAIRANELRQGLREPCFFISCISPASRPFPGGRHLRENGFCIQYFPKSRNAAREECNGVADRLFAALEWITVDGDLTMGTRMRGEFADGVLNFFVSYDMFVCADSPGPPPMEELSLGESTKKERQGETLWP